MCIPVVCRRVHGFLLVLFLTDVRTYHLYRKGVATIHLNMYTYVSREWVYTYEYVTNMVLLANNIQHTLYTSYTLCNDSYIFTTKAPDQVHKEYYTYAFPRGDKHVLLRRPGGYTFPGKGSRCIVNINHVLYVIHVNTASNVVLCMIIMLCISLCIIHIVTELYRACIRYGICTYYVLRWWRVNVYLLQ